MLSQSSVFDQLALDYDSLFTDRAAARWLRQRVRNRVCRHISAPARILDVGCGTGDDAIWLVVAGHRVTATDTSEQMLELTRKKAKSLPKELRDKLTVAEFDASVGVLPDGEFDAIWSNFGALNCVEDLGPFLDGAAARLDPGGVVALVLMGRFCLWETLGFAARREFRRASRRWSGRSTFSVGRLSQDVWYHSGALLTRQAREHFDLLEICGIGVFVPPTEFFSVCDRFPRFFQYCVWAESRIAYYWPFNRIADHCLFILRRRDQ